MRLADDFEPPFGDNYQPEEEGSDTYQDITITIPAEMVDMIQNLAMLYLSEYADVMSDSEFQDIDKLLELIKPGIIPFKPSGRA